MSDVLRDIYLKVRPWWLIILGICVGVWGEYTKSDESRVPEPIVLPLSQEIQDKSDVKHTDVRMTPEEMYQMAMDFYYGRRLNGTPDSKMEYAQWLQKSAESGYVPAQFRLGSSSTSLCSPLPDGFHFSDFFQWVTKAADQNIPEGVFWKGYCYLCGVGVERDEVQGLKLLRDAADQGSVYACTTLASWYDQDPIFGCTLQTETNARDEEESTKWKIKAVELSLQAMERDESDIKTCYLLASFYRIGYGVLQDEQRSQAWMERARTLDYRLAEHGDVEAMCAMGQYCSSTGNIAEAKKWYRQAAESGYWIGQCYLAHFLATGDPSEREESLVWFRRAAEQGWSDAQYHLGEQLLESASDLENRENTSQVKEGLQWLHRAAYGGSRQAQLALGTLYAGDQLGRFVSQDLDESRKWFTKAAQFTFDTGDQILGETAKHQLEALKDGRLLDIEGHLQQIVPLAEGMDVLKQNEE